jgi:hypothetical protein
MTFNGTLGFALLYVFHNLILLSLNNTLSITVLLKEDFATGIFYENEN